LETTETTETTTTSERNKPLNKKGLIAELVTTTELSKAQVELFLTALVALAEIELRAEHGQFVIPDLVKLSVSSTPAKAERPGRNPATGEAMMLKAKPASKTLRASAPKKLKAFIATA
jgi:DNA-binding protein HU-beta